jgi:adenine-specific DNA-methyltransferase
MVRTTSAKKLLGQYFTISENLQQFVFDKVKHKGATLLEPSFGAGHLLKKFKEYDTDYPMCCYELDKTVVPVVSFSAAQKITYGDFTGAVLSPNKFKTIVGNPPYVKQTSGNLYIKFIELCVSLLDSNGGELIFIVPSDFIKLTSASSLIESMVGQGSFTDFLFPHDEKLFEGANIDVVAFRYEKGVPSRNTIVNGLPKICNMHNGILTFSDTEVTGVPLSDIFNVYVGLVSGRDEVYRVPFGNMDVLTDKDKVSKFIFTESFPTADETINAHLLKNKNVLLGRKIRAFSEANWFEWGAPRNKKSIEAKIGVPCIYVRNMTRKLDVAFVGTVQYFGGTLLCLIPKKHTDLQKIVELLNSAEFRKDYLYSGRFKIGHKQISNVIVS